MFPLRDDRPTYTPPVVTTLIIIACSLVFLYELLLDEYTRNYLMEVYGVVPAHFRPITLLTSLFLHGGFLHIIGNMLFLWAFGKSLEDALGHTKFLAFYLIAGLAAGITHVVFQWRIGAAYGRRERRHCGSHGRLSHQISARSDPYADLRVHFSSPRSTSPRHSC